MNPRPARLKISGGQGQGKHNQPVGALFMEGDLRSFSL